MSSDQHQSKRVDQMRQVQQEALELFTRKNRDYGDSFAKHGPIGVLMRITDKMQRCVSITRNGINLVADETFRDTMIDLHNYSAMCVMLLDEPHDDADTQVGTGDDADTQVGTGDDADTQVGTGDDTQVASLTNSDTLFNDVIN